MRWPSKRKAEPRAPSQLWGMALAEAWFEAMCVCGHKGVDHAKTTFRNDCLVCEGPKRWCGFQVTPHDGGT